MEELNMRDRLPVGPYKMAPLADGTQAPWYLMPFDKFGTCEAPATRTYLIGDVHQGRYTDIFLFSHGWNNDWSDANALYDGWLKGYAELQQKLHVTHARPFKPLFIGVIWPSTALVFPSERGPRFAGAAPNVPDALVGQERDEIRALAEAIPDAQRPRFYALTQQHGGLTGDEALELAQILAPVYQSKNNELDSDSASPAPEELRDLWTQALRQLAAPESSAA